jgi:hypothetical protein
MLPLFGFFHQAADDASSLLTVVPFTVVQRHPAYCSIFRG